MTHLLQVPAVIESLRTLKDNTLRLTVDCQELRPEDGLALMQMRNQLGYFVFKPNKIDISDMPKDEAKGKEEKSPSLRLRNTLFVEWKMRYDKHLITMSYDEYYKIKMEAFIQSVKDDITALEHPF